MANPEGAKAREPYQNFDGEGLPSESTKSPLPWDRERGLGIRSRPLLMKKGLGVDGNLQGTPCKKDIINVIKVWGFGNNFVILQPK